MRVIKLTLGDGNTGIIRTRIDTDLIPTRADFQKQEFVDNRLSLSIDAELPLIAPIVCKLIGRGIPWRKDRGIERINLTPIHAVRPISTPRILEPLIIEPQLEQIIK